MNSIPAILDVDPGHDDAVAIMLACAAPELDLLAITTVAGNVSLEKTTRNALRILSLIGHTDLPVAAGASFPLRRALHTAEDIHGAPAVWCSASGFLNRDSLHHIPLFDLVYDILPAGHLPEDCVFAIEVRSCIKCDEELRPIGVFACIGH